MLVVVCVRMRMWFDFYNFHFAIFQPLFPKEKFQKKSQVQGPRTDATTRQ